MRTAQAAARPHDDMTAITARLLDPLRLLLRRVHHAWATPASVCYFPTFSSGEDLANHYHRARWYLPRLAGRCESVRMFHAVEGGPDAAGARPLDMGETRADASHISIEHRRRVDWRALIRSRLVLVWRVGRWGRAVRIARRLGIPIVSVDTADRASGEYVNYCALMWRELLTEADRAQVLRANYRRFAQLGERIRELGLREACVFGTGPTLEKAFDFDFSKTLTVACNSIVRDSALLEHIRPAFLAAADVVSHFGVSRYAAQFRADLVAVLRQRDIAFVTVASAGYLFVLHHPEVADKVILIDQRGDSPNYDLLRDFRAPALDSVLNSCMLPLAATFCRRVLMLGCDGRSTSRDNEDFWAHAGGVQYRDLVETARRCHPTFDLNRRVSTYANYSDDVARTVLTGECEHGIVYRCLRPSNIPVLNTRCAGEQPCDR